MASAIADGRVPVIYSPRFREFGVLVDGGPSKQLIEFCPFCGAELPSSLRVRFFDELDRMGLELEDPDVPLDFRSDAWWRMRGIGES
jgi:hypothetical protein